MTQSCRDVILNVWKDNSTPIGTNGGLLRDRYLWLSVKDDKHKDARDKLHEAIREAVVHSTDVYRLAFANNSATIQMPKGEDIFLTSGRMIIGLGGENVLETGITLQHTYGTPLIPGSALKGLAAHYCDQVWGASDPKFKLEGDYHKTIFGTSEDSGHIIFYDAWITPESLANALKPDVMTPHHSDYYSNKDDAAPTDFDSPTPITFLSVAGSFHIAVSCDVQNDDGDKWAKLAFKMLTEALKEWGIGGKTNAGYGRLVCGMAETKIPHNAGVVDEYKSMSVRDTEFIKTGASTLEAATKAKAEITPIEIPQKSMVMKYHRGEIVEVTREVDPKGKGRSYFKADDGFGGFVHYGSPPSLEIGQKTRLEISGKMENSYSFAVSGSAKEIPRKRKDVRKKR